MNKFPTQLKLLRGEQNQSEFAQAAGISVGSISRYERGASTPDLETIEQICAKFGINPKWLLFGEEPMRAGEAAEQVPAMGEPAVQTACGRCRELEKEVTWERENSRKKDELLVEWLKKVEDKIEESGQLRVENMKLQMNLDTARQMCKEYQAENMELKKRLSLSTTDGNDTPQTNTA